MYVDGLNRLDAEAKQRFGIPFAGVNLQQADALIRPWLRTWMTDHPPTDPYEQFMNLAHSDIRTATINSKPWSDALPADHDRRMEEGSLLVSSGSGPGPLPTEKSIPRGLNQACWMKSMY